MMPWPMAGPSRRQQTSLFPTWWGGWYLVQDTRRCAFCSFWAIADDAAGLIILAVFYPQGDLAPIWLMLSVGAAVAVYLLFNVLPRRLDIGKQLRPASTWVRNTLSFWPYLLAAGLSWYGFMRAGLHPSLGLLPIVSGYPSCRPRLRYFLRSRAIPDRPFKPLRTSAETPG